MDTILSLMQVASVLGISMQATRALVRRHLLRRAKRVNKVVYFEVADVQAYLARTKMEQQS